MNTKNLTPIYIELPGWNENISSYKSWEELPKNCKEYVETIEKIINIPISLISVGPDRNQTFKKCPI